MQLVRIASIIRGAYHFKQTISNKQDRHSKLILRIAQIQIFLHVEKSGISNSDPVQKVVEVDSKMLAKVQQTTWIGEDKLHMIIGMIR